MQLLDNLILFKYEKATSPLFFCVHRDDFERYGQECAYMQKVIKGVSDDADEAYQDYQFNFILAAGVGLESDERRAH
ncbi:hypothetical protein [Thalassotalea sp. PP2-459]|uniref:hypothetical protein n=1 Tax=Thalassotalea sp. PP2-459 TaxID=1742724 RepID=UPI000944E1DB|nr:hypothetical protein [Thalassotalea sp. PP2-459]OKY27134.1 hypothetical protein BI291_18050 [Thalassotalea sp. PP2-459]